MTFEKENLCAAPQRIPVPITDSGTGSLPRLGRLGVAGWFGTTWDTVAVIGETAKRYRITTHKRIRLAGRYRWLDPFCVALVPKTALRFSSGERKEKNG
jgi:hypothetical protein